MQVIAGNLHSDRTNSNHGVVTGWVDLRDYVHRLATAELPNREAGAFLASSYIEAVELVCGYVKTAINHRGEGWGVRTRRAKARDGNFSTCTVGSHVVAEKLVIS